MEDLSVVYAKALFELAIERKAVDEYLDQAVLVCDALQGEECRRFLMHPHIPASEKCEFLRKAFSGNISEDMMGLLFLAVDKNREAWILPALTAFIGIISRYNKRVTARVTSATSLNDNQVLALVEMLSKKLGKQVEVSLNVEPGVIGGPYIDVDGHYVDSTIKKRLHDLTNQMKEGCRV